MVEPTLAFTVDLGLACLAPNMDCLPVSNQSSLKSDWSILLEQQIETKAISKSCPLLTDTSSAEYMKLRFNVCLSVCVRSNVFLWGVGWLKEGVAVGGDEQPLSFHSNTPTRSVSMATDNSISWFSLSEGSFFFFLKGKKRLLMTNGCGESSPWDTLANNTAALKQLD